MTRQWTFAALAAETVLGACVLAGAPAHEAGRRAPSSVARPRAANPANAKTTPARSAHAAPAFDGKLVALTLRGSQQPKLLEQARFVEIKGRTFLVRKEVRAALSFPLGANANVAWDAVDAFYIFDSVEQYEAALHEALQGVGDSIGTVLEGVFPDGNEDGSDGKSGSLQGTPQTAPQYKSPQANSQYSPAIPEPGDRSRGQSEEHVIRDREGRERRVRIFRGQDGCVLTVLDEEQKEEEVKTPQLPPYSSTPEPTPTVEGGASLRQKLFNGSEGKSRAEKFDPYGDITPNRPAVRAKRGQSESKRDQ